MSTSPEYLPETPEALTPDWLSSALGISVRDVRRETLGEGLGFMGEILRLKLVHDDPSTPVSLVAKLPRLGNRVMGELLGVYEREIMFYRTFSSELPVRVPRMVYGEFDRDRGSENQEQILRTFDRMPRFLSGLIGRLGTRIAAAKKRRYVLLIEDLVQARPADQLAGLDEAGCRGVLTGIAPLHRAFWLSPRLRSHFWLLPMDVDARLRQDRFQQCHKRFAALLNGELDDTLAWMHANGERLTRRFVQDAPETLAHSDLRLDNVMFEDAGCAFIDWQLVRRAPAAYDIAYFISSALHESCDADSEERLLRQYHRELAIDTYTFEALVRDYRRAMLIILANLASADEVDLGNERGNDMMSAWLRRLVVRVKSIEPGAVLAAE